MKHPNLPVVRKCSVQPLHLRLDFRARDLARDNRCKEAAAVANQHDLLRAAQRAEKLFLDRLSRLKRDLYRARQRKLERQGRKSDTSARRLLI